MERHVSKFIGEWVEQALDQHAQGDKIAFETAMNPGPQGQPVIIVALWLASPMLGQSLTGAVMMDNPLALEQDKVIEAVRQTLENLRQERTKLLSPSNGHGTPPSGLVVPT